MGFQSRDSHDRDRVLSVGDGVVRHGPAAAGARGQRARDADHAAAAAVGRAVAVRRRAAARRARPVDAGPVPRGAARERRLRGAEHELRAARRALALALALAARLPGRRVLRARPRGLTAARRSYARAAPALRRAPTTAQGSAY